ncbi:MAG: antibiotic biosynthesis monooxygenase [Spirochaetaceae bacterium]|nr:antibiotic biosynthesis monooxygenase [Spirochaetaceae bacterium]
MQVVVVSIKVTAGSEESFRAATLENAKASRSEPGIFRFDLLQDAADESRFLLVEGYRDELAPARHKETEHYQKWKALAEPMMAEPRQRAVYRLLSAE